MKKSQIFGLFILIILSLALVFPAFASRHLQTDNFLVISDIHLNAHSTHPMEFMPSGNDMNNDLDPSTMMDLLKTLNKNIQSKQLTPPKFIFVLGDIVCHDRLSSSTILDSETEVFRQLKYHFPTTPIFYVFGNNDSFEADYGPFLSKTNHKMSPHIVAEAAGWQNGFLSTGTQCGNHQFPCLLTEDKTNGYYAAYLEPQFRLLALNSILFSSKRKGVTESEAQAELAWLESQLASAKAQHESVLIALHIPPGFNIYNHSSFWLADDQEQFLKIIQNYAPQIVGILAGHTHVEEIKIFKDNHNQLINAIFFTAGFSTSHGNMPSVKQFYYQLENDQWSLSDYDTLHFLKSANQTITLESLYHYNQYYCQATTINLLSCLDKVTIEKIAPMYTAGNTQFAGIIKSPEDIILPLPH